MNLDEIKLKANTLGDEFGKTQQRRDLWKSQTKGQVLSILNAVKDEYKTLFYTQAVDAIKNQEFVNLHLLQRHSNIFEIDERGDGSKSIHAYLIDGGYLVYTQAVNGRIYVIISYPYVAGIIERIQDKVVGCYEPSDISEKLVLDHVKQYLDEMLRWENHNASTSSIGFDYQQKKLGERDDLEVVK
ncbi:MAG TPA: hypothetical protein VIU12_30185 [Chryseolinea sp.]